MTVHVLVAVASKHGSTQAIGERMGHVLGRCLGDSTGSVQVDIVDTDDVMPYVDSYDAVVIGSGLYAGHWLASAQRFAALHRNALLDRPVWCFSSGLTNKPPTPDAEPTKPQELAALIGARGYCVFAGKLDRSLLSFAERAIVNLVRSPDGDFRDWKQIDEWAGGIASQIADLHPRHRVLAPL